MREGCKKEGRGHGEGKVGVEIGMFPLITPLHIKDEFNHELKH